MNYKQTGTSISLSKLASQINPEHTAAQHEENSLAYKDWVVRRSSSHANFSCVIFHRDPSWTYRLRYPFAQRPTITILVEHKGKPFNYKLFATLLKRQVDFLEQTDPEQLHYGSEVFYKLTGVQ